MINTKDIYYTINNAMVHTNFWQENGIERKRLLDEELKKYAISKLSQLGLPDEKLNILENNDISLNEVLEIMIKQLPKEQQREVIDNFTHYILGVAGNLQSYSITWWEEVEDDLIKSPLVQFNERNLWSDLKTHHDTDALLIFNHAYNTFVKQILLDSKRKNL